jgi:hypothetical protein
LLRDGDASLPLARKVVWNLTQGVWRHIIVRKNTFLMEWIKSFLILFPNIYPL